MLNFRQGLGIGWKDLPALYFHLGSCGCSVLVPRYNIAVDGHCLPELGTSVLELSVFLQPKHGAFNNGSQDAFVVCAVPLQLGPRLPLFLVYIFMFLINLFGTSMLPLTSRAISQSREPTDRRAYLRQRWSEVVRGSGTKLRVEGHCSV